MSDGDMPFSDEMWHEWWHATAQQKALAVISLGLQPHGNTRRNNGAYIRTPLLSTVSRRALRVAGALNFRINMKLVHIYRPVVNPAWQ